MLRTLALTWLGFKCLRTNPLFHSISFRSVPPFRVKNGPIGEVLPLPRWVGWSDYEGDGARRSQPGFARDTRCTHPAARSRTCHQHREHHATTPPGGNETPWVAESAHVGETAAVSLTYSAR